MFPSLAAVRAHQTNYGIKNHAGRVFYGGLWLVQGYTQYEMSPNVPHFILLRVDEGGRIVLAPTSFLMFTSEISKLYLREGVCFVPVNSDGIPIEPT